MTTGSPHTLIASVQRALLLVDIVANAPRPVPVKAIARASGLSLGTAYNITRTLVHEGYLATEPDGLVLGPRFPGMRSAEAGVAAARTRATLHGVTERLGVTAYLSRFDDGEVQVVDLVEAAAAPRLELWVGISASAHATALGKQILAELGRDERLDYLARHPLAALTPNTIVDRRALLSLLERPAEKTLDRQEYALGHSCVAVPVRAPGVVASLAIALPELGPDLDAIVATLKLSAARLSLELGTRSL